MKADVLKFVYIYLRDFFALKGLPRLQFMLCLHFTPPAFYSQYAVCILHTVCILPLVRRPQSAVRSPRSTVRSPQSTVHSPQSTVPFTLGAFHLRKKPGNSNRENGTTFSDFPLFLGIFQWDEPTKRVPFTAEPEIPEILTKWKAPTDFPYMAPTPIT